MVLTKYSLICSNINGRNCYGIRIEPTDGNVYVYKYISTFYEDADELLHKMSKDYISPVHFNDIVTDYLAQLYYAKLSINGLI